MLRSRPIGKQSGESIRGVSPEEEKEGYERKYLRKRVFFLKLEWKSEEWLSVREHISGTTCPIFTKLFVRVIYRRSSIFLWRRCDVLPVLWMTLCSHIIGHMGHVSSDEQLRSKIEYVQTKTEKNPPMNMYWILLNPILNRPPVCLSVRHTLMSYQHECCKVTAPILVTHQPPR